MLIETSIVSNTKNAKAAIYSLSYIRFAALVLD